MPEHCSHLNCQNEATQKIVFIIHHKLSEHVTKIYPPIFACDECATEQSAAEIFSYKKGRDSIERNFKHYNIRKPDWQRSQAKWILI